jgi:SAM-dependent methyltransferase
MAATKDEHANVPAIEWNWDAANYFADWHEPIYELMARYVPERSRVLEVGAGGSHTLAAIAGRLKCESYGVEPDENGIAKTNELADLESGNVKMVRGDGFRLPFADGVFDVVYSLGLIEHFDQEGAVNLVSEHFRVCSKKGIVIVAVPNLYDLSHTARKILIGKNYEYYPERSFAPFALQRLIQEAGTSCSLLDGSSPFWGIRMSKHGGILSAAIERSGLRSRAEKVRSAKWRARFGFLVYAVATKKG